MLRAVALEIRLRFGNYQINLAFLSPCTNFATMKRVVIFGNSYQRGDVTDVLGLIEHLQARGVEVAVEREFYDYLSAGQEALDLAAFDASEATDKAFEVIENALDNCEANSVEVQRAWSDIAIRGEEVLDPIEEDK